MDQLRYYLAACLFLIATHSASASVTDALSEAGFSCFAATDGFGTSFGGTMCTHEAMSTSAFTLDEAISVYVPSTTGVVVRRIVLYLQGFRGVCGDTGATPADVMNVFDLAEQMQADSPPDSVLVFPMSHGHDTTYYRDFAATGGPFAEFMNWIETIVGEAQWSLAGHSGAGDVIAKSLNLNPSTIAKFDAIELLDAAYNIHHASGRFRSGSEAALWQTIAERNPSLILSCIGNGTYSGCQILAEQAGFVGSDRNSCRSLRNSKRLLWTVAASHRTSDRGAARVGLIPMTCRDSIHLDTTAGLNHHSPRVREPHHGHRWVASEPRIQDVSARTKLMRLSCQN